MRDKLLRKTTALVMSSLVVFLGQASAIASSNQKIAIADNTLSPSESIIAEADPAVAVGVAVAIAINVLGEAFAFTQTAVFRQEVPEHLVPVVEQALQGAQRNFAEAQASAERGEFFEASQAMSTGISILGEGVQAVAGASTSTTQVLTNVIISAEEARAAALAAINS